MPLAALLYPERPTMIGHLIYGAILGRFPVYQRGAEGTHPTQVSPEGIG